MSKCQKCADKGRVRSPCTLCGAIKTHDGVVYAAGRLFGDVEVPYERKPKRKRRDRP